MPGNGYDNAVAESVFGLLKREHVTRRKYTTRAEARADIFDDIEQFYSQQKQRLLNSDKINHTTLN
ncbi:MAG TPA: hypothetical protein EYQ77_04215 [Methylococcaceae bacterium]|nr:hypothetical protein [Methylococcaceae bacterium]HIL39473.1 hypothetical protein [Methylococcales bacterium]